ncbi:unnamed protein product [Zymoseptoria tritici ST99CH_3D7]|uniref:Nucleolar protein 9 n=1 Tax=Zymoseptoria tritici (strain ST99CH_3D7) TaxID=1276538 RepID=A0A1X7S6Z3_ZYMT9|nr:unnamed protein product [Zymoseptoria tritici ST99CH_3D7]
MPKEGLKRGRRMKRKHEDVLEDVTHPDASSKRIKEAEPEFMPLNGTDHDENMDAAYPPAEERVFFGMLDDDEQEYFKRADEMLELDQFSDPDERKLFLESVYREADGKELKIAHSQSCSRLMERLIRVSNASQLKNLFQKFSGNFIHMLSHRFASHCCETLFTYAAPLVSEELTTKKKDIKETDVNDVYVSLENLFLHTLAELEGNLGFLLTDKYASHALRVLLLVLSGSPATNDSAKSILHSKRREGAPIAGTTKSTEQATDNKRPVPKAFSTALEKLIHDSVAGLDTDKLRALATHPSANPTLQLLLTLELTHYGKQRAKDSKSIIRTLLPDDPFTSDCESAGFISGLVYDPVGAHLVERIIENAPAKLFKSLYNQFFKERLASHAKNETATYVVCRILGRLGYDDLLEAHEILLPIIPTLLERQWTSLTKTLIERCTVRDIDTQAIAAVFEQTFQKDDQFDVGQLLKLEVQKPDTVRDINKVNAHANGDDAFFTRPSGPNKVHFNILAQSMLIVPGSLSALILDSMTTLEAATLLSMASDHVVTRTLQQAFTTKNASMIQRRKLIQRFYGNFGEMALDKSASHVVDCIWEGTHGLAFIRERIAEELAENEAMLRDSPCGRAVWKNWKMDMYKRKRPDWVRQSRLKASNEGFQAFSEIDAKESKTPLQIARERHAQAKAKREKEEAGRGRTMARSGEGKKEVKSKATGANRTRPVAGSS